MKRKPKIYISAPITGYDLEERRKSFAKWAQIIINAGCEPVNPMEKNIPDDAPYVEHMKADINLLLDCDGYILSTVWTASKGCRCENAVAEACDVELVGFIIGDDVDFIESKIKKIKSKLRNK